MGETMITPLHIEIAMHYHCRTGQYEMVTTNETRRRYADDLADAGLLTRVPDAGSLAIVAYGATPALAVWIKAICSVPFPVQWWVIPAWPPTALPPSEDPTHG